MHSGSQTFDTLKEIVSHFNIKGEAEQINPYGSGHINDTFQVINTNRELPDYLLQRVNSYVFKDVPLLISNIERVTDHIKKKLENIPGTSPDKEVLTLIRTTTNECFYLDEQGNYWRMYLFLKNTVAYDVVKTINQAYEGGKAFGRFQALISDLNAELIGETIPDFHNIEMRLNKLKAAIDTNSLDRVKEAAPEIDFVMARVQSMSAIRELGRNGKLPLRITHNDTKFNNVLLDKNDHAQCVIDLDTVMPGYIAYDFGDSIRTIVNTVAEDEADLAKIDINIALFEGFTKGFLQETGAYLTEEEIKSLAMGALLLPYLIGVRFLTDYLEGDIYFKTRFAGHNLQRSRAQLQLLKKLEENYPELQAMVQKIANQYRSVPITN